MNYFFSFFTSKRTHFSETCTWSNHKSSWSDLKSVPHFSAHIGEYDWFLSDLGYCKYFRQYDDRFVAFCCVHIHTALHNNIQMCVNADVYFQVAYSLPFQLNIFFFARDAHIVGGMRATTFSSMCLDTVNKRNAITFRICKKNIYMSC